MPLEPRNEIALPSSEAGLLAMIVLSAREPDRLPEMADRLRAAIIEQGCTDAQLDDIAYTLQVGREEMDHRLGILADSIEDLVGRLGRIAAGGDTDFDRTGERGRLLLQWTQGTPVDWDTLYRSPKPRTLSLPSYPFAGERLWHTAGDVEDPKQDTPDLMVFEEAWVERVVEATGQSSGGTVLLFAEGEPAAAVERALAGAGRRVVVVGPEAGAGPEHFAGLGEADAVAFLWGVTDTGCLTDPSALVSLVQGLSRAGARPGRLILGFEAGEDEILRCHGESWVGFARSLRMPLPGVAVSVVCREPQSVSGWGEVMKQELPGADHFVVHTAAGLRVRTVQPVTLSGRDGVDEGLLVSGGVYLITGGMGGLGTVFCDWLAERFGANLVLVGRGELDERRRRRVQQLEAAGASVLYVSADVSDVDALRDVVARAKQRFGRIDGVVHAAGVEGRGSVLDKDSAQFAQVLAPKVAGAVALDEALRDEQVGFVCFFSSSSAVLGDFGGCDYAMGNRFLMSYGRYRAVHGLPGRTVVVCWPLWRSDGMGMDDPQGTEFYLRSSGQRLLEPDEGISVLRQLLGQSRSEHLVMAGDPAKISRFLEPGEVPDRTGPSRPVSAGPGRRPAMRGWPVADCLLWELRDTVAAVLELAPERVVPDENLAEFGFDSISLASFARELTGRFGFVVTPDVFFGYPTLTRLAEHLSAVRGAELAAFYQEDGPVQEGGPVLLAPEPVQVMHRPHPVADTTPAAGVGGGVAVVGLGGRFAGLRGVSQLWPVLVEGRSLVGPVPAERCGWWRVGGVDEVGVCAGFVPGVTEFDAGFFQISPREAEGMDPRQRLLLQESWVALEDAGYGPDRLVGERVGVFVGAEESDFPLLAGGQGGITGSSGSILASRLAYFLNAGGPGMLINTSCSSGLVAVHQAAQSLRSGECDVAVVAGVNLMLTSVGYQGMARAGMLSASGELRAFDGGADGMVPAEAVAVVVLKRLEAAERAGDAIYASIVGSGINYDGKTNGITAPSGRAQAALLREVYDRFGIDPGRMGHIVTHGTGTKLGDPVEINALADAFSSYTDRTGFCALTSVKPNVGHTLAASGVVSLISLVLGMREGCIPASINCEEVNDYIRWEDSPFFVNRQTRSWEGDGLLGAVSSFGMSGTNAHVVVQSYGRGEVPGWPQRPAYLLAVSARTAEALTRRVSDLGDYLRGNPGQSLAAVSYELLHHRQHFAHRVAVIAHDHDSAVRILSGPAHDGNDPNVFTGTVTRGFTARPAIQQLLTTIGNDDLHTLADLYCQGYDIPAPGRPAPAPHLDLPPYPFTRDEYLPEPGWESTPTGATGVLHPLVHRNDSDLTGLRFGSAFTGREWFVHGDPGLLAADAVLELARVAVTLSSGGDGRGVRLQDVVWHEPVPVGAGLPDVQVAVSGVAGGGVGWDVYSADPVDGSRGDVLHGSGRAGSVDAGARVVDLAAVRAGCSRRVDVGEQSRVAEVWAGGDGRFLVRLASQRPVLAGGEVVLQPGDVLAVLAAVAGPDFGADFGGGAVLGGPGSARLSALRSAEFCATGGTASVAVAEVSSATSDRLIVDVDGCDDSGVVLWTLTGVELEALTLPAPTGTGPVPGEAAPVVPETVVAAAGPGRRSVMRGWPVADCLSWELVDAVSVVLGLPPGQVAVDENLAEFGFDSISLASFARELTGRFGFEVTPDVFFGYPTVARLAVHLLDVRGGELAAFYQDAQGPVAVAAPAADRLVARRAVRAGGVPNTAGGGVAVVGLGGRFAGLRGVSQLWPVLVEGRSLVGPVPAERCGWWRVGGVDEVGVCAGFVPGVTEFDAGFFQISPREAEGMDPRQRLLLQESWVALEDAGYGPDRLVGERVGVFVGAEESDFPLLAGGQGGITGSSGSILASRLAYFLNAGGPGMLINTSCSSGLVAVHQAAQSLRSGECDVAVVAGVNLMLTSVGYQGMARAGMLSASGELRAFDGGADGMVPAEAVAVVVLKRLEAAERAGDAIYASIVGSGINYDGKTNGITAPSGRAQAALLREVYDRFGIDPGRMGHIVTHGTGTKLGDPVEINALADAFSSYTDRTGFCALTSVKPNVGHTLAASGVVSLISLVLGMREGCIPASINCEEVNDYIRWEDSPFFVNRQTRSWEGDGLLGAVSSFGMSGTNAHVVVQSYGRGEVPGWPQRPAYLLAVSARTAEALTRRVSDLGDYLRGNPGQSLAAVSYELLHHRQHFAHRVAVIAHDHDSAVHALSQVDGDAPAVFAGVVQRRFVAQPAVEHMIADLMAQTTTASSRHREVLCALAEFYCQGYDMPAPGRPAPAPHLDLPPYPFAAEQYAPEVRPAVAIEPEPVEEVFDEAPTGSGLMVFGEAWVERVVEVAGESSGGTVVVFADGEVAAAVEGVLVGAGRRVVVVGRGSDVDAEFFAGCFRDVGDADAVAFLWGVSDAGCVSDVSVLLALVQGLAGAGIRPGRLILGFEAGEGELLRCHGESWVGFARSLRMPLPGVSVSVVCREPGAAPGWGEVLAGELPAVGDDFVVHATDGRRVRAVVPVQLSVLDGVDAGLLVAGGVYLVTGGMGGLGRVFCDWLAERFGAALVLVGRGGLDERRRGRVRELEAAGASVLYVSADVSDVDAMRDVVAQAKERFGRIDGVIHAAGVEGGASVLEKDAAGFAEVLAPKVSGVLALDEALRGEQVGFVAYFSSSSAVLGDFGGCDYAMGNRFLMSYGRYRAVHGLPGRTVVVCWPLWRSDGMGVGDAQGTEFYLRSSGQRLLEPDEGIAVLQQLLGQDRAEHVVMAGDPVKVSRFLRLAPGDRPEILEARADAQILDTSGVVVGPGRRPEMRGWSVADCLLWELRDAVSAVLHLAVERVVPDENLAEFGFDSISLADFARELTGRFGFVVTPDVFFGFPTVARLSAHLLEIRAAELEVFYRDVQAAAGPVLVPAVRRQVVRRSVRPASAAGVGGGVAVVGLGGRFAGLRGVSQLWPVLVEGRSLVGPVPAERCGWWRVGGVDEVGVCAGFVPGVTEFDAGFFQISPREAEGMDPRQRLLLQESWVALEDAGYGPDRLVGERVGVFVGAEESDFPLLAGGQGGITGSSGSILASRLAYFLNAGGPGMLINTSCSSGLVAVHQAAQSLRSGECDVAVVAGVNLMLTSVGYQGMARAGMLSASGELRAFDGGADGMVPAEAVAVVVLKRLEAAERAGDAIYASIVGSGINYDGKTNGITAPSGRAQAALLREVYDRFGIDPGRMGHIVTHGTGTKLGDPVEINALADAFSSYTDRTGFCALTSVKPNVGHTLAASGVVSLISLVLGMREGCIPASINCEEVNDYIRWEDSPFFVNRQTRSWEGDGLLGAVSSFGMSGTNAHVVVQSYGRGEVPGWPQRPAYLLAVSARTAEALTRRVSDLGDYLRGNPGQSLAAVSYELLHHRQHFAHRVAVIAHDHDSAVHALSQVDGDAPAVFAGVVQRRFVAQPAVEHMIADLMAQTTTASSRHREVLCALAEFYCQGYDMPAPGRPAPAPHLDLPPYPFAAEQYAPDPNSAAVAAGVGTVLHPLVHRNDSDLDGVRFTSAFSGQEWYAAGNELTADGLLEAVRAAAGLSSTGPGRGTQLQDVVWHEPAPVGAGLPDLHIALSAAAGGGVRWDVYSADPVDGSRGDVLHGSGRAGSVDAGARVVDLAAVRAGCSRRVDVGEQSRVAEVWAGGDGRFLVRLASQRPVLAGGEVVLQPGDVPAVLAAVAGPEFGTGRLATLRTAEFAGPGTVSTAVVVVSSSVRDRLVVDIDGCDDSGTVLWALGGLEFEPVAAPVVLEDTSGVVVGPGRRPEMRGWSVADCLLWELRDAVSAVLHLAVERVVPDENLAEFGFDSISLADFARELTGRFGFVVTPDVFFGFPTVARLSAHLLEIRAAELEVFYRDVQAAAGPVLVPAVRRQVVRRSVRPASAAGVGGGVAVVGLGGRFAGLRGVSQLWPVLVEGRSLVGPVPAERCGWWRVGGVDEVGVCAGFVPGVTEFDAGFFQISPREAEGMDPRQRLLLQESWVALEDAGYGPDRLVGERVGVFVGAEESDFPLLAGGQGGITGSSGSILASRLAYFLNAGGPGMLINTSCSSGLVAVHQAAQSLRSGECDVAVVAGVNLMLTSVGYQGMARAGMLSASGELRAFDGGADGMVPAEAVAVVVLKRLEAAERAGDAIYASIVGSGINYDGKTNGITAPSGRAQAALLREVYDRFGIDPGRMGHIVTHGTGTKLGDPVEINALADAFSSYTDRTGFCALTSVKPNVGHTLAASGVVSLISLVLGMREGCIPASINCEEVNDYIRWEDSPFFVNRQTRSWEGDGLLGAVSSFGMSGTNAHVVVQSYGRGEVPGWPQRPAYLLAVSARTAEALTRRVSDLGDYLRGNPGQSLAAVSYELLHHRQHFAHRVAVIAHDHDSAVRILSGPAHDGNDPNVFTGTVTRGFTARPAIQQLLTTIGNDDLHTLADLYCQGYDIPAPGRPAPAPHLDLPPYPFAAKEYRPVGDHRTTPVRAGKVPQARPEEVPPARTEDVRPAVAAEPAGIVLVPPAPAIAEPGPSAKPADIVLAALPVAVTETPAVPDHPEPLTVSAGPAAADLLDDLVESLAAELFLEPGEISLDQTFTDLGLDSIIGVEWIRGINKRFGLSVESTRIYQYPTLPDFARYVGKQLPAGVTRAIAESTPQTPVAGPSADALLDDLVESLAAELFLEPGEISLDQTFTDLGLDSIIGVEWIRGINKRFGLSVESTRIYQFPTLPEFARYVRGEMTTPPSDMDAELSDLLQQVYSGEMDPGQADAILSEIAQRS